MNSRNYFRNAQHSRERARERARERDTEIRMYLVVQLLEALGHLQNRSKIT